MIFNDESKFLKIEKIVLTLDSDLSSSPGTSSSVPCLTSGLYCLAFFITRRL